jgi:Lecithin retinol acyltransferase
MTRAITGEVGVRVLLQSWCFGATGNVAFAGTVEGPMTRGDHIFVRRFGYTHHGIYLGDGTVIGYSGEPWRKCDARIGRTSVEEFARGGRVDVRRYGCRDDAETTVERAESRIDETDYNLLRNNCEHFAAWCVTGQSGSAQVDRALAMTGVAGGSGAAAAVSLNVVAAVGVVPGVSGPGVMSGLGAVGGVVGGGAVAGLVLLGAIPAVGSTLIMHRALRDDVACADAERAARTVGRWASMAGGAAGIFAGISAVEAAGTVAGLSGAGIASGLFAVGPGGMVGGAMFVTALPSLLAAALGYIAYRTVKWWLSWSDTHEQLQLAF